MMVEFLNMPILGQTDQCVYGLCCKVIFCSNYRAAFTVVMTLLYVFMITVNLLNTFGVCVVAKFEILSTGFASR
jgi:hypothetical protein